MRVLSPADPGYVEWCRSGMPQRIRLLKLAAEKRRRIEQGVICPKCHRRRVRAGDTLCARCLKLVREQARPMCPKCGRCRCLEGEDMCGRCRAHRVLPSCSRCGAPRRKGSPDGLCGRCRQLLSGKART